LGSSEDEEASIHETDDDKDRSGTDDCEVAAAWEDEESDIECNSNKAERATFSTRTAKSQWTRCVFAQK
jgi:hypothetical protein